MENNKKRIKAHTRRINGKVIKVSAHNRKVAKKPVILPLIGILAATSALLVVTTLKYAKDLVKITMLGAKLAKYVIVSRFRKEPAEELEPKEMSMEDLTAHATRLMEEEDIEAENADEYEIDEEKEFEIKMILGQIPLLWQKADVQLDSYDIADVYDLTNAIENEELEYDAENAEIIEGYAHQCFKIMGGETNNPLFERSAELYGKVMSQYIPMDGKEYANPAHMIKTMLDVALMRTLSGLDDIEL